MNRDLDELLEAGRELATLAEELRDLAPRAVDAALIRWMQAVNSLRHRRAPASSPPEAP